MDKQLQPGRRSLVDFRRSVRDKTLHTPCDSSFYPVLIAETTKSVAPKSEPEFWAGVSTKFL